MSNRIVCAVIVMHDDTAGRNHEASDEWNPRGFFPNAVAGFMDLHWEQGFTNHYKYFEQTKSTVFVLDFELKPKPLSALQNLVMKTKSSELALCNSLKLHFFYQNTQQKLKGEFSNDFLYSSAVPLEVLVGGHGTYAGVFNYNLNETKCYPIGGISICVVPLAPVIIPRNTLLLVNQGADLTHHRRLIKLTNWIFNTISSFVPSGSPPGSQFAQMRTFGRDYGTMLLFQDLHKLFDAQVDTLGHALPPALAVYALCNALIVNECHVDLFIENLKEDFFLDKKMAILSDAAACFRMCAHEGIYWPDMSCKKLVEDQPFPDACLIPNRTRVFKRDDCEGRTSQVFMMISLFRAMGVAYAQNPIANFAKMLDEISPKNKKLPLRLEETTLRKLLCACIALGIMLHQNDATDAELENSHNTYVGALDIISEMTGGKKLQVHTVVGDAIFPADPSTVIGHSFSMAMDPDNTRKHCIIETTAWEHVAKKTEKIKTEQFVRTLVETLCPLQQKWLPSGSRNLIRCAFVSPRKETATYSKINMSHDYIFFTQSKADSTPPQLGAKLADMRRHGLYTFKTGYSANPMVFRMRTRRFIEELCAYPSKDHRLWPAVNDAETMLEEYDKIQKIIPSMRRAVCPPPRSENEILDIMSQWGIIEERHTQTLIQSHVLFSIPNHLGSTDDDSSIQNAVRNLVNDDAKMLIHPFMHSHIFRVFFS